MGHDTHGRLEWQASCHRTSKGVKMRLPGWRLAGRVSRHDFRHAGLCRVGLTGTRCTLSGLGPSSYMSSWLAANSLCRWYWDGALPVH